MTDPYTFFAERAAARGIDLSAVEAALRAQRIETPSWAFGNSGTRFAVFAQPGAPRNTFEKLEDAAQVQRHTGVAPLVALHIPWDRVDDFGELRARAKSLGLGIGAINPNLFQEPGYRLGSVCNPNPAIRRRAVEQIVECVDIARTLGSDAVSLWLADGTNYAGQDSFRARRERLVETLAIVYAELGDDVELLVEYKFYEPALYATDLADWGSALLLCQQLGERARVLVDLGHHAHGVNIEQIVSLLHDGGRLGGFHFNDRRYGDDDLMVGSVDPFQLFCVYAELIALDAAAEGVRFTLDQSHNIEPKIEATIQSILSLQEAYAKALLVDRAALAAAQAEGDVLAAHRILLDGFQTDVRPLCARVREDLGASADAVEAFRESGYQARAAETRVEGTPAAWI
jgi:L-rhamnose isomerase / sugar isomerase